MPDQIVRTAFGYDPGGTCANGLAFIRQSPNSTYVQTHTVDSVNAAIDWVSNHVDSDRLDAAGIDTFLSWSTKRCGWRPMDDWLRKQYPPVQGSVFSSNSAAGSMAVQGIALAHRLREAWPEVKLNETHPKVLYFALTGRKYLYGQEMVNWLADRLGAEGGIAPRNEHEWDALISAWYTLRALTKSANLDLMQQADRLILPLKHVTYFWPQLTDINSLLKTARQQARKAGMKKSDIEAAIRKVRKRREDRRRYAGT